MRFTLSGLFLFVPKVQKVSGKFSGKVSGKVRKECMDGEIDFRKMQGLAPAIVQDAATREVLMLGFMNPESWERTLSTGHVTFFSRTRQQLWTKGETSGNRLKLVAATIDCDRDTLLLQVEVEGAGLVCHEGTRSCFTQSLSKSGTNTETTKTMDTNAVRS
jgi:phosphoribosyl-AMP cyclohydrolase